MSAVAYKLYIYICLISSVSVITIDLVLLEKYKHFTLFSQHNVATNYNPHNVNVFYPFVCFRLEI
ncbi:uncharacterized protein ASCRUDRAFT_135840 [Ascoidea rubescens DSM 1968]|uniref:Uncharacterized protein n=1 Tax=Ascoidea rubescens DSM 1968 TaxID=1344418 RepID=A0A1D2VLR1_9ASCO|nr:hypothetical protein ASCRUDRAFT_135840 [Ascoidea rubescens DSM 1968]ODV62532.1 hypothetical protein ASCRUDRAFT_135840 [Ascoidea rubescens DSM 1968]